MREREVKSGFLVAPHFLEIVISSTLKLNIAFRLPHFLSPLSSSAAISDMRVEREKRNYTFEIIGLNNFSQQWAAILLLIVLAN